MRRAAVGVLIVVLVSGCASTNPRHGYAVASQSVAASLFGIQDAEEAAYRAGKLTPAQHMSFNQVMAAALSVGREFNTAVLTWTPGSPPPEQLPRLKDLLQRLSTTVISSFPPDVQAEIQRTITATYDAVLAVMLAMQAGRMP